MLLLILQVIMPGYCVQGTVGHKILNGAKKIDFENRTSVEVNLSVEVTCLIQLLFLHPPVTLFVQPSFLFSFAFLLFNHPSLFSASTLHNSTPQNMVICFGFLFSNLFFIIFTFVSLTFLFLPQFCMFL